jgi:GNAT superfamily N-acetyltransferase
MDIRPLAEQMGRFEDAERLLREGWPPWIWAARRRRGNGTLFDVVRRWPQLQLLGWDGEAVALANAVPLDFDGPLHELADEGWDWAVDSARQGSTLCALAVTVAPHRRGEGHSRRMLDELAAMRDRLGFRRLVVAVRPTHLPVDTSCEEWLARRRVDGLPSDPWLRTHVRAGGQIVKVCARSMRLTGAVKDWARWTGADLKPGPNDVPGLLAPLVVQGETADYVEPNIWVAHLPHPRSESHPR